MFRMLGWVWVFVWYVCDVYTVFHRFRSMVTCFDQFTDSLNAVRFVAPWSNSGQRCSRERAEHMSKMVHS